MQTQVVLTSSQSKRLIAKGIAAWEPMRQAMRNGVVVITRGTTNGYIAEELLAKPVDKTKFVSGRTAPAGVDTSHITGEAREWVIQNGSPGTETTSLEATSLMGPGDIFLKGANAINYDLDQAGILVGHPTGGTIGGALGTLVSRKARLVHPAGLEKNVPGDLAEAARRLSEEGEAKGDCWGLFVTHGELFTEIEAFETLCDVQAVPVAAGGILGAEGSVTIALFGSSGELDRALALVTEVQREGPFGVQ